MAVSRRRNCNPRQGCFRAALGDYTEMKLLQTIVVLAGINGGIVTCAESNR
jgi:hypothetical protein